jgi:hypothetical protein
LSDGELNTRRGCKPTEKEAVKQPLSPVQKINGVKARETEPVAPAASRLTGNRVQFNSETWNAINLMRQERRRSFQQLAEEAFRDLLTKYHRPQDLKAQLRESVKASVPPRKAKPRQAPTAGADD